MGGRFREEVGPELSLYAVVNIDTVWRRKEVTARSIRLVGVCGFASYSAQPARDAKAQGSGRSWEG